MSQCKISKLRLTLLVGVSAATLLAGPHLLSPIAGDSLPDGQAYAQSHGGSGRGQGGGGRGGSGYRGGKAGGHSGEEEGHSGSEGGGHESEAEGSGHKGGGMSQQPGASSRGGRPVWAQEGIPAVELGRLSVVRSPDHVIDKALTEVLKNFNPAASAALYSMSAEQFSAYIKANWDTAPKIDSPLENLGLFKDLLSDGQTRLSGVTPASKVDLAAIFLGAASDKNLPVSSDTVIAVTKIMGLTLSDGEVNSLATKAETARQAILEGHG